MQQGAFLDFIMRVLLIKTFVLFGILTGYGQKDTHQVLDGRNIHKIEIKTDEVYKISIQTSTTEKIKITTHSEGEYYNNIALVTQLEKDRLRLTTRYPEALTGGYDKLSAHKVISMEIQLEIPEDLELVISSNLASVMATGNYKNLYAELQEGFCRLLSFKGNATINTYKGNIYVEAGSCDVKAETRNGQLNISKELQGTNILQLTSINGDISVLKTK